MNRFFIDIYRFFKRHRIVFLTCMVLSVLLPAFFATRVRYEKNLSAFFPDTDDAGLTLDVFNHLNVSDRIMVLISEDADSPSFGDEPVSAGEYLPESVRNEMSEAAGELNEMMMSEQAGQYIKSSLTGFGIGDISAMRDYVMSNLPVLLDSTALAAADSLTSPDVIETLLREDVGKLMSPQGSFLKDFIIADPLGMGSSVFARTAELNVETDYKMIDGHLYTEDGLSMICILEPYGEGGHIDRSSEITDFIEAALDSLSSAHPHLLFEYFSGSAVGVYNARQISKDTVATSLIALIIIIVFILMVFKRKRSIFLILIPVAYGAVFALGMIGLFRGSISGIAIGASSAIFGIALSYSIHMLAHQNHVHTMEQLIEEIVSPMTIGSFTTVGAFIGLLFTSSALLRDFGLFAALMLVGTTLFCLFFLPQFLSPQADVKETRLLEMVEKFSAYPFEKNKWIVGGLVLLFVFCCFYTGKVGFNSDMMDLNYWEPSLKRAEEKLNVSADSSGRERTVMIVSTGRDDDAVSRVYARTNAVLDSLKQEGIIEDNADARYFIIAPGQCEERFSAWNALWTEEKKAEFRKSMEEACVKNGFKPSAFSGFTETVCGRRPGSACPSIDEYPEVLRTYVAESPDRKMLVSYARIKEDTKEQVYAYFDGMPDVVVFDQSWITNKAASSINSDFNWILFFSSFLIFFALCISYGRLELALLSFLPMFVSWIIITGIMAFFGIKFNIVNIILTTFIFGMGDDFSIFILDGLISKYSTGKSLLSSHKTAIFFSTFTIIVGIGVLVFARHPALHSIAVISILGMLAVVLVAYVVEPLLFDLFVIRPTSKGLPPVTFMTLVRMAVVYLPFGLGCILILALVPILSVLPVGKKQRQMVACYIAHYTCRLSISLTYFGKLRCQVAGNSEEEFEGIKGTGDILKVFRKHLAGNPEIIVANHQSSADIPEMMALSPRIRLMANEKVLKTPLVGFILRYMGAYAKQDGYEHQLERLREDMKEGWSVAIFPEGTRSVTGDPARFHKGAFYLAGQLGCNIRPVVIYGNNHIWPKAKPFALSKGLSILRILPPVSPDDKSFGESYRERAKSVGRMVRQHYNMLCDSFDGPANPYFKWALIHNYIYRGPVTEWYVRVKIELERNYMFFDQILPKNGRIVDIGCGMGQLDYMLAMGSEGRSIVAVDYDESKIQIASHGWLKPHYPDIDFICADAVTYEPPQADAFVISDMLHYLAKDEQFDLILRCMEKLHPGGILLIRDANAQESRGQNVTSFTEIMSTKVFKFNKALRELNYLTLAEIEDFAYEHDFALQERKNDCLTSNTFYILRKTTDGF